MDMPAFLPEEYIKKYSDSNTNVALLEKLVKQPSDLIVFFEYATDDETWSEEHHNFMRAVLKWLTFQYYQDRLFEEWARRISLAIQKHFAVLDPYLPKDYVIKIQDKTILINSLMLGVSSVSLKDLIRHLQRKTKDQMVLNLSDESYELFTLIAEYINKGFVEQLWKKQPEDIVKLLTVADKYDLKRLSEICQGTLRRYINPENALEMLLKAHKESWKDLEESCFSAINDLSLGVRVSGGELDRIQIFQGRTKFLHFEFLNFSESALKVFNQLKDFITHLICSGSLTEDPQFSVAIQSCPQLIGLDISRSRIYSPKLNDIPHDLQEIDISKCLWLTDIIFERVASLCPAINRLTINSNVQLSYKAWAILKNLDNLRSLDISRCTQINDESFDLILKSSTRLIQLGIEDCKKLSENSFFKIARSSPQLLSLNAARCNITDGACIDIVSRCPMLRVLNLSRCPSISDKGILQVAKIAENLQLLVVTDCTFENVTIERLKNIRSTLTVEF